MSKRKQNSTEQVVIEFGGPGLDAFNECFGFAPGTTTHTYTASKQEMKKPITKTAINKQVKEKEDKIKQIIIKHLKKKKFPIEPDTLKFFRRKIDSDTSQWYANYTIQCKENLLNGAKIVGYIVIHTGDMKQDEDLLKRHIYLWYEVDFKSVKCGEHEIK